MKIVASRPPNFDAIVKVMPAAARPDILFCYGDTVYCPAGGNIHPAIIAHETKHSERQAAIGGPEEWWRQYLDDMDFRFHEELLAHRAEFAKIITMPFVEANGRERYRDRNARRANLKVIAERLSGPIYNHMVTFEKAKRLIMAGDIPEIWGKSVPQQMAEIMAGDVGEV